MSTPAVILILILFGDEMVSGFRAYKFSRSVDTNQFYGTQSPCPSVFQYQNDENGNLVGALKVDRTDPDGRVQLDVELSVGNSVQGYNGKIILAEERQKVIDSIMNQKPIFYRILFPAWQNIPPKITKIAVNGNLICTGPRIPIQIVPVLTTINLQHKLSLGVTPLISSSDPTVDISTTFDNVFNLPADDQDNTHSVFDVRAEPLPSVPNNIYADDFGRNPFLNVKNPYNFNPAPPKGRRLPPSGAVQNINNPFNFNPVPSEQATGGGRPVPEGRPSPQPRPQPAQQPQGQINPQNPFLTGLSTPEPSRGDADVQIGGNNPFFNQGTERPPILFQPSTDTPPRGGPIDGGTVSGNLNDVCGRPIPTNSLIVNGQTVPRGAYPWLVAIFKQLDNLSLSYICSGSLISQKHVVTAAHCVRSEYRRVKPNEIVCVFGKLNIRKWVTATGERMLEPDTITIHPDYEPGKANADIAVMTFPDPIPFSKIIMPVCLWQGSSDLNQVVGNIGTVVGWGRDENGDVSTAEPRQVSMPIVDQLECLKGSSSTAGQALVEIVSKNTFCAGFRNGSGPCNGDSGSGFLLRRNGIFYLRGIVSTALSESTHRSCNLQEYVVFTDASKYIDWLMRFLRQS